MSFHEPITLAERDEACLRAGEFSLRSHLAHQRDWSARNFGPGTRAFGITAHIASELAEIRAKPDDLDEWIDVVILAFDGALRQGFQPWEIVGALIRKQAKNEARRWPDWRHMDEGEPIEHLREEAV